MRRRRRKTKRRWKKKGSRTQAKSLDGLPTKWSTLPGGNAGLGCFAAGRQPKRNRQAKIKRRRQAKIKRRRRIKKRKRIRRERRTRKRQRRRETRGKGSRGLPRRTAARSLKKIL